MSKRLYVGGLPYSIDNSQLEEMFSKFGEVVTAIVIMDRTSGRSKGFGFVEMKDDPAAVEAIATLNGTELDGRKITVSEARPRVVRSGPNSGGGGFGENSQRGGNRY